VKSQVATTDAQRETAWAYLEEYARHPERISDRRRKSIVRCLYSNLSDVLIEELTRRHKPTG
jgi:hypothetical protein